MVATSERANALEDAAFGGQPGLWPLPAATTPTELWWRAVAAGGQGRYACAFADLERLRRGERSGKLVSLAHSTHASFLRQLGWHDRARRWDGRAWALAGADVEAGVDALAGLAADALGVGRFAASRRSLQRVDEWTTGASIPARQQVRLAWVSAELAMVRGDGVDAVSAAQSAADLASRHASARHRVKSDVILAAALCCAGELERSQAIGDAALESAQRCGLVPLRWALACLLTDIGSMTFSAAQIVGTREGCADTVRRRGGRWARR
jgi:hypothetical protein